MTSSSRMAGRSWNGCDQRIVFDVGYRAVGSAPYLGDAVSGLSGRLACQIGGGK